MDAPAVGDAVGAAEAPADGEAVAFGSTIGVTV
jgi:hypothetical protein